MGRSLGFLRDAFSIVAIVLFALAGYLYWRGDDLPRASIDDGQRELTGMIVGRNSVSITVRNPTPHKIRVLGAGFC